MNNKGIRLVAAAACLLLSATAWSVKISDVRGTKHNLSAVTSYTYYDPVQKKYVTGSAPSNRNVTSSQPEVCVFCHTPHNATTGAAPIWNRAVSGATYTKYSSSSLDAGVVQGTLDDPNGSSKLCLSCHDGTMNIGAVNVLAGKGSTTTQGTQIITMSGTSGGTSQQMPTGSGATSGFTRNLGTDLSNDHPISLSYTAAVANRDGELRVVDANQKYPAGTGTIIGVKRGVSTSGYNPLVPLEPTGAAGTGQIQCASCHDPHIRELDTTKPVEKFLRLNRFQLQQPTATYNSANDIVCLACHSKDMSGAGSWAYSAHANSNVATQTYVTTAGGAAATRDFVKPDGTPVALPVWQAGCLNCHDTHTVQGARRLLREGTDSTATPKTGGNSAIEEVCYACHSSASTTVTPLTTVPPIKEDFTTAGNKHMPIKSTEQAANTEKHDIGGNFTDTYIDCSGSANANKCGANFIEQQSLLGYNSLNNRHAECPDCHNPHRVIKGKSGLVSDLTTTANTAQSKGTHAHDESTSAAPHSNVISGVLRGTWGVEPSYPNDSFHSMPNSFSVKKGDPGTVTASDSGQTFVTREYQICMKCHSNYGYNDDNAYPNSTSRPSLGSPGTTASPSGHSNFTSYTNQAKEFQAPSGMQGPSAAGAANCLNQGTNAGNSTPSNATVTSGKGTTVNTSFNNCNHRSWHPVMNNTNRNGTARGNGTDISNNWRAPFNLAVGTQTMYCTDCHGSSVTSQTSVNPNTGKPWGPHGSANNFILKGDWTTNSGAGASPDTNVLCFKCHDSAKYAPNTNQCGNASQRTGFWINSAENANNVDGHCWHGPGNGKTQVSGTNGVRCNWCHVAVPHGWKNKSLLVNLNDVGPEAGLAAGTEINITGSAVYNNGPYYRNAKMKIAQFRASGTWGDQYCGSTNQAVKSGAGGNTTGTGKNWMTSACKSQP